MSRGRGRGAGGGVGGGGSTHHRGNRGGGGPPPPVGVGRGRGGGGGAIGPGRGRGLGRGAVGGGVGGGQGVGVGRGGAPGRGRALDNRPAWMTSGGGGGGGPGPGPGPAASTSPAAATAAPVLPSEARSSSPRRRGHPESSAPAPGGGGVGRGRGKDNRPAWMTAASSSKSSPPSATSKFSPPATTGRTGEGGGGGGGDPSNRSKRPPPRHQSVDVEDELRRKRRRGREEDRGGGGTSSRSRSSHQPDRARHHTSSSRNNDKVRERARPPPTREGAESAASAAGREEEKKVEEEEDKDLQRQLEELARTLESNDENAGAAGNDVDDDAAALALLDRGLQEETEAQRLKRRREERMRRIRSKFAPENDDGPDPGDAVGAAPHGSVDDPAMTASTEEKKEKEEEEGSGGGGDGEQNKRKRRRFDDAPALPVETAAVAPTNAEPLIIEKGGDAVGATVRIAEAEAEAPDRPRNPEGIVASERRDEEFRRRQSQQRTKGNLEGGGTASTAPSNASSDMFDMFGDDVEDDSAAARDTAAASTAAAATDRANYTDAEGYYRATIGEYMGPQSRYKVLGIIGKGVFSTVIRCVDVRPGAGAGSGGGVAAPGEDGDGDSAPSANGQPPPPTDQPAADANSVVAIKLIRNNETMAKAAQKELRILRLLSHSAAAEPGGAKNCYCVKLLDGSGFDHVGHTAMVFEHMDLNLRETLHKFGRNVGINIGAVRTYGKQLLSALAHLGRHGVVHADIKPDNVLVSGNYGMVKLCDFGSAFLETDLDNDPTPYLVSRFYRPPEVILGLEYDRSVDLWSVATTLAELFTGTVLFPGTTNNDMIRRFMDCVGPFSHKMLRRHFASYEALQLPPHFDPDDYRFRQHALDRVTGRPVVKYVAVTSAAPSRQLARVLLGAKSRSDDRGDVLRFADLLGRCLTLDPGRRIAVDEALGHDFVVRKKKAAAREETGGEGGGSPAT